jgi:hypothetical protein
MNRRTMFALLVALVTFAIAGIGGSSVARAQNCGMNQFNITGSCLIPAACFPISVDINWGPPIGVITYTINACGTTPFALPAAGATPVSVKLDPTGTASALNSSTPSRVVFGAPCNSTLCAGIQEAPPGCFNVHIGVCM